MEYTSGVITQKRKGRVIQETMALTSENSKKSVRMTTVQQVRAPNPYCVGKTEERSLGNRT